jgi:hypothetical protein
MGHESFIEGAINGNITMIEMKAQKSPVKRAGC